MTSLTYTLAEINEKLGTRLEGDGTCIISGVAPLHSATTGKISFCDKGKYRDNLLATHASAVILAPDDMPFCRTNALITTNPYLAFAKVAALFAPTKTYEPSIHPTAIIGKNCSIAASVYIGPYVVIEDEVTLGEHTVIHPHCFIGQGCVIGSHSTLWPRVTLYAGVTLGHDTIIHSGAIIGSDGFGYSPSPEGWHKIPQVGTVTIGNRVEIGANTTIDRGTLDATHIADGVKLDNQIQVAHNVKIGENTAIAACTGIAGSTTIGKNCMIAGGVGIAGHIEITDNVILTGMAMVTKSINEPGVYSSGTGILSSQEWRKNAARFRHLNELALKVRELESKLKG